MIIRRDTTRDNPAGAFGRGIHSLAIGRLMQPVPTRRLSCRRPKLLRKEWAATLADRPAGRAGRRQRVAQAAATVRGWTSVGCFRPGSKVGTAPQRSLDAHVLGRSALDGEHDRRSKGNANSMHFDVIDAGNDRRLAKTCAGNDKPSQKCGRSRKVIGRLHLFLQKGASNLRAVTRRCRLR
jgi:hypothetical protein